MRPNPTPQGLRRPTHGQITRHELSLRVVPSVEVERCYDNRQNYFVEESE